MNNREITQFNAAENDRRQTNAIRLGTIEETRYDLEGAPDDPDVPWWTNEDAAGNYRGPLYRVRLGDHKLYWMPQMVRRACNDLEFWAYEVGEQVLVLCMSGDPMQSVVLGSLPQNAARPPVGWDDITKDQRPWRETVRRERSQDGRLWEYDRVLHRELTIFPDGTRVKWWCHDDRQERDKEGPSDKTGAPPRHWHHILHADQTDYEHLWDEDTQVHHRHWRWPDGATVGEYTWDEQAQTHTHHLLMADGADYVYLWDEAAQAHIHKWVEADGTVRRYVWTEGNDHHLHETAYADGTVRRYEWASPHRETIQYADGTVISYDLDTHHLSAVVVGPVTLDAVGNVHVETDADLSAEVAGNLAVTVGGNASLDVTGGLAAQAGGDASIQAGGVLSLSAAVRVEITAPELKLTGDLSVDGDITATGENPNHHNH